MRIPVRDIARRVGSVEKQADVKPDTNEVIIVNDLDPKLDKQGVTRYPVIFLPESKTRYLTQEQIDELLAKP